MALITMKFETIENMKRILYIVAAAVLFAFAGCNKSSVSVDITGEWELSGVEFPETRSVTIGSEVVSVYIEFASGGTFVIYQMLGAGRYESYEGTWTLAGDVLSGKYSDNTSWATDYQVSVEDDVLTMTVWPDETDVYTYTRCTIPDDII